MDSERVLGPDDYLTLSAQESLANAYLQLDRSAEAVALLEATLTASERVFGPEHPLARHLVERIALLRASEGGLA